MTIDHTAVGANPLATGVLLVAGLVIGLVALVIMIADDALPALSALLRGSLKEMAPHVFAFRLSLVLWALSWVAMLFGIVLLTRMLVHSGDDLFPIIAVAAIIVAAALAMLEASFGFTVTSWAVGEAAEAGTVPTIYTVLNRWVGAIQVTYIVLGLAAQATIGVSILKTELLPAWVGQTTLVWSLAFLVILGLGIPAVVFIMPALIGVVLMLS